MQNLETYNMRLIAAEDEIKKLKTVLQVTHAISSKLNLEKLLTVIMELVKEILNADRCTVFLLDIDKNEVWSKVAHGIDSREIRFPATAGIVGAAVTKGEVLNIPDAYEDPRFNKEIDKKTGYRTKTILTIPMKNQKSEIIGAFQVLNKKGDLSFTKEDESLLEAVSVIAASQIENAQLYDEQKKTFDSFIETLAVTIDLRDYITGGHSQRVTLFADEVSKVLNYSSEHREVIRCAALLHDIGKIGVRESVLFKDGKLDDEEYRHIQSHALYTAEILGKINFSRELKDVPFIASTHHEKVNGNGYFRGLSNEAIPEGGKLLAVVDVFDALTSRRQYRDRMDIKKVIDILEKDSGFAFDEIYVDAIKQVSLAKILSIMELGNESALNSDDFNHLNNFTLAELISFKNDKDIGKEIEKADQIFMHCYLRKYQNEDTSKEYET